MSIRKIYTQFEQVGFLRRERSWPKLSSELPGPAMHLHSTTRSGKRWISTHLLHAIHSVMRITRHQEEKSP